MKSLMLLPLSSLATSMPPVTLSPNQEPYLSTTCITEPATLYPNVNFSDTYICLPPPVTINITINADEDASLQRRKDVPGDRKHAQFRSNELPSCKGCARKGYCVRMRNLAGFHDQAPPLSECDTIRRWAEDSTNLGHWEVKFERMRQVPWIPLITAGSCTVVISTDFLESEEEAIIISTKDVARLMEQAVKREQDGTTGASGEWEYCSATAWGTDMLFKWPTKFQVMLKSELP
ncbi:uncharacterized protein JN550_009275 [Neoarthrinium moseri]|uniref:uncharacterized protein n=1 Tax=Neoarthrinium moseri TaxID=1658444 RepID=UPI001FDE6B08|nr:uncharacterized protein JN550_009275 [Neoarthrinium moseri]KAI1863996.1 hypothetical protein JN550_009275 [Neoarthrinium moseri]